MAKGYLKHRGASPRGNTWCKRCARGQKCKFANPQEIKKIKLEPINFGKRPGVMKNE